LKIKQILKMHNKNILNLSKAAHTLLNLVIAVFIITMLPANNIKAETTGEVTVDISLPTIQCGMCEQNINKALDKVKGVKSLSVDLEGKKVTVTYDDAVTSVSKIEKAITKAGYDANNQKANKKAYDKLNECCKVK
jgi:periplasmic mercuric ion binding protein